MEMLLLSGARALQLVSLTTPKLNEFSVFLLGLSARNGMAAGIAGIRHRIRLDPFRAEKFCLCQSERAEAEQLV